MTLNQIRACSNDNEISIFPKGRPRQFSVRNTYFSHFHASISFRWSFNPANTSAGPEILATRVSRFHNSWTRQAVAPEKTVEMEKPRWISISRVVEILGGKKGRFNEKNGEISTLKITNQWNSLWSIRLYIILVFPYEQLFRTMKNEKYWLCPFEIRSRGWDGKCRQGNWFFAIHSGLIRSFLMKLARRDSCWCIKRYMADIKLNDATWKYEYEPYLTYLWKATALGNSMHGNLVLNCVQYFNNMDKIV